MEHMMCNSSSISDDDDDDNNDVFSILDYLWFYFSNKGTNLGSPRLVVLLVIIARGGETRGETFLVSHSETYISEVQGEKFRAISRACDWRDFLRSSLERGESCSISQSSRREVSRDSLASPHILSQNRFDRVLWFFKQQPWIDF